jgi:hypothetical protein
MKTHDLCLLSVLLSQLKEDSSLERGVLAALLRLSLGLLVLTEGVHTAGFIGV